MIREDFKSHPDFPWKMYDRALAFVRQHEKRGHADLPRIKELIEQIEQNSGSGEQAEAKQREIADQIDNVLNPPTPEANPEPVKPDVADLLGEARVSNVERPELLYLKQLAQHMHKGVHWKKYADGPCCIHEPLRVRGITAHLKEGPYVGLAPIVPGTSVTRAALLDLDDHKGETGWEKMVEYARRVVEAIETVDGLRPQLFRSSGGKGIHIYLLWQEPQDAYSVRQMLADILKSAGFASGTKGVDHGQVEIFPKQDEVKPDGVGSMWILPFAKNSIALDAQLTPTKDIPPLLHSKPVPVLERPQTPEHSSAEPLNDADLIRLQEALDTIPNDDLDYDMWRNIIFAIHHATDGSEQGRAMAEAFSAKSSKHNAEFFNNRVWPYVRSDRGGAVVTAASIFARAREHGFTDYATTLSMFEDISNQTPSHAPVAEGNTDKPNRFVPVTDAEFCSHPAPAWLVRNVIPRAELVILFGESTAGKSFVAEDIAYAISRGVPWFGEPCEQGRVVYVCAEGAGGFRKRVKAYRHQHGLNGPGIEVIATAPDLLSRDDVSALIRGIGKARLVIIDTLAASTPGGNENTSEAMGKAIQHCKAIHQASRATVMLVAHTGKDQTKGVRGWSGIKAAADAQLEVIRVGGEEENGALRYVKIDKQKDGEDGRRYYFKLLPVTLGLDEQGDPIGSCVVEQVNEKPAAEGNRATGKWQVAVYKAVLELQGVDGQGALRVEVLNNALERRGYTDGDAKARRMAMNNAGRALRELIVKSLVQVEGDRVLVGNASSEGE
jgi:hypothetical protein